MQYKRYMEGVEFEKPSSCEEISNIKRIFKNSI